MNYYDVLGVSPTATPEVINATHKALAKMYHPDVNSSKDANEKMAMLNEANEVLSDAAKREEYDNKLRRDQQQGQNREILSSQPAKADQSGGMRNTEGRAGKAELLRRKAEARLKTVEDAKKRRMEQAQQKAEKEARRNRQAKVDLDKQHVVDGLSEIVMGDNAKRSKQMDVDEERYYATKVLLSMVRKNDNNLQIMAEEAQRKQRVEEILALVKEYNDKKEWV